jgi:hypothetical protein
MDVYSLNLTIFLIATFAGALVAGLYGSTRQFRSVVLILLLVSGRGAHFLMQH